MVSTFSVLVAILPLGVTILERLVQLFVLERSVEADTWYEPPSTAFQERVTVLPDMVRGVELHVSTLFVPPL